MAPLIERTQQLRAERAARELREQIYGKELADLPPHDDEWDHSQFGPAAQAFFHSGTEGLDNVFPNSGYRKE